MNEYEPIPGPYIHHIDAIARSTTHVLDIAVRAYRILGQRDGLGFVQYDMEPNPQGPTMTVGYPIE